MEKIIIPFGEECYTCQSIDSKFSKTNLRSQAFPFDYVGHTYIENVYDNINDLLNSNDYICTNHDFYLKLFGDKYFMCHKKYNFKYWHDIYTHDDTINIDCDIAGFVEKYNRRYSRLKNCLLNSDNATILSVNHFDNIYNKKNKQSIIYNLFNLLKSYNTKIKFVAINFGEDLYNVNNLKFINLPINYEENFLQSKDEFTKCLNDYISFAF